MDINDKEVVIDANFSKDGAHVNVKTKNKSKRSKASKIANLIDSCGTLVALIAYILFGALGNWWNCAWVVFFIPNIISSFFRAVDKKDPNQINIAFIACFVFFFVCMWVPGFKANLWHPMWVTFLFIPVYYIVVNQIKNFNKDE